jgi:hypothetical protein
MDELHDVKLIHMTSWDMAGRELDNEWYRTPQAAHIEAKSNEMCVEYRIEGPKHQDHYRYDFNEVTETGKWVKVQYATR